MKTYLHIVLNITHFCYNYYMQDNKSAHDVNQVFNVLLLVVLLLGGVTAIVGSAFGCCSGLCCAGNTNRVIVQERVVCIFLKISFHNCFILICLIPDMV